MRFSWLRLALLSLTAVAVVDVYMNGLAGIVRDILNVMVVGH